MKWREIMPYYYSLDEICKKLYIGYLIDRKYEGTWIVASLPEGDNKIFKIKKRKYRKTIFFKIFI